MTQAAGGDQERLPELRSHRAGGVRRVLPAQPVQEGGSPPQ